MLFTTTNFCDIISTTMQETSTFTRRYALLAVLTGCSLVVFLIENRLPPLFFPGAKIGLANFFTLCALVLFSPREGILLVLARTILGAMFATTPTVLLYSLTGGLVSVAVSALLLYSPKAHFSLPAVSATAAVLHNLTQCCVFALITATPLVLWYFPYLALIGCLSGCCIGILAHVTLLKLPLSVYRRVCK